MENTNLIDSNIESIDNIKPHYYYGSFNHNIKCFICDKEACDVMHYRNAGIICDNADGPCSCGAWHKNDNK